MWPVLGGLISGGASLLGNVFSAEQSGKNVGMQEQYALQNAQIQDQFQEQMSNTAYQRASADMKAAGLNPMMMFGSGGPASTPGGAGVPVPTAQKQAPLSNLGDVVTKTISSANAVQDFSKNVEETRKSKADADWSESEAYKNRLSEKEAELKALEASFRYGLPKEDIMSHATSEYKYGGRFGQFTQPAEALGNVLDRVRNKLIENVTGPSGQALFDRARGALQSVPKYVGPGGSVVDTKDFPSLTKNTAQSVLPFSSPSPRNFDERYGNWR